MRITEATLWMFGAIMSAIIGGTFGVVKALITRKQPRQAATVARTSQRPAEPPSPAIVQNFNITNNYAASGSEPPSASSRLAETPRTLNAVDAQIYVTRGSTWCKKHPRSEDVIWLIDYTAMTKAEEKLNAAAFPPTLDASEPPALPFSPPELMDDGPVPTTAAKAPLPSTDGAIWLAQGSAFTLAPSIPATPPPKPEPAPVIMPLLFTPIPPADGELWLARGNQILPMREPRVE